MAVILRIDASFDVLAEIASKREDLREAVDSNVDVDTPSLCLIMIRTNGRRLGLRFAGVLRKVSHKRLTRQPTLKITNLVALPYAPSLDDWLARLKDPDARTALTRIKHSERFVDLVEDVWIRSRLGLVSHNWQGQGELDRLEDLMKSPPADEARLRIQRQQKDHVLVSLNASGFSQRAVDDIKRTPLPQQASEDYLDSLLGERVSEDLQINYDSTHLPGWFQDLEHLASRVSQAVSVVFEDRVGHRLRITNINRHPLEGVTGADLLYRREDLQSYVFVQYKSFRRAAGTSGKEGLYWHPDSDRNFPKQAPLLRQADRIADRISTDASILGEKGYRMHPRACWLKLVHPEGKPDPSTPDGLVDGMYLPFDYFDALSGNDALRGPKDGTRLSYETVDRYLNTTLFVDLLKGGWIGSRGSEIDFMRLVSESPALTYASTPGPRARNPGTYGRNRRIVESTQETVGTSRPNPNPERSRPVWPTGQLSTGPRDVQLELLGPRDGQLDLLAGLE